MTRNVTAMDLGTSNTCVTSCTGDAVTVLRPEAWHNAALGGAIPTLILYKNDVPFLIGAAAELEFGEATDKERHNYMLHSQFKPDISVQDAARHWMEDFLRLLRTRINVEHDLLVGIPCQAGNHYQQLLRQCLQAAGWENARFLREPIGAIIHYIASGVLPPSLAAKGVLTIDFGGGTCDLAVLKRAAVTSRYGDMLYGGRLFDDLIYQMLLEHNPHLRRQLDAEGNHYYVHWVACRRAKEDFSQAIHNQRDAAVTVRVRWSHFTGDSVVEKAAYIPDLRWETFLARAGEYVASPALQKALQEHAQRAEISQQGQGLLQGKKIDLITWFEDILLQALQAAQQDTTTLDMPHVLLTGGSSAWPFVEDIVRQTLGERASILIGDEPYADIAKGLAQYHILTERLQRGRTALREDLPIFMEERIRRHAIHRTLEEGVDRLMEDLGTFLRTVILLPEFQRYKDEGGSLRKLMQHIALAMQREDAHIRALLTTSLSRMGRGIAERCRDELKNWFRHKGIPIMPEKLEQTWLGVGMDSFLQQLGETLGQATLLQDRNMAALATTFTSSGVAALAVSGAPLTAAVVGIGGVIVMKLFHWDEWVVNKSLGLPIPGILRRHIFRESRLDSLCDEQLATFEQSFRQLIFQQWEQSEGQILAEAARVAGEEIDALDIINISPV